jgi:AcrR family transcriptional regulator
VSTRLPAADRRAAILEAAMAEFGEHGFEGATTDAIARRAGISQPYVIRLFGTKRDLFTAAVERVFDETLTAFEDAAAAAPPGEARLHAMGRAYTRLLEDRRVLLMHLQAFAASGHPEVRTLVRARMSGLRERVMSLSGVDANRMRDFLALGMLLNVVAALDLPELLGGDDWRECILRPPGDGA